MFKVGDRVRVIKADPLWMYWCPIMNKVVGKDYLIESYYTFNYHNETYPTIIIKGWEGACGLSRNLEEYAIPEHCLEYAIRPGEQLLFPFMKNK